MEDYLSCLAEKVDLIEDALQEASNLRIAKAKRIHSAEFVCHRISWHKYDLSILFAAGREELSLLHRKDLEDDAFGTAAAPKEKRVDEFGRDLEYVADQGKATRQRAREAKQKERLAQLRADDNKQTSPILRMAAKHEGWGSDDDSKTGAAYAAKVENLLKDTSLIFSDADEKFHNFDAIQKKFAEWRLRFNQVIGSKTSSISPL